MQKIVLLIAFCFYVAFAFAQTNTFPSTGSAGVGTTSPATLLEVKSSIDASATSTQFVGPYSIGFCNDYAGGDTAQWLLLSPYLSGGSGSTSAGLTGTITFYRGSTTAGNFPAEYHVNVQTAYNSTIASVTPASANSPVLALYVVTYSSNTYLAVKPREMTSAHTSGKLSFFGHFWNNFSSPQNIKPTLIDSSAAPSYSTLQSYQSVSSNAMYVTTSNNIGIGLTAPSQKLHVSGNILAAGNVYIGGGNGITVGSKTTGYALAVNGTGIFNKVMVKPYANWPDYVFEPDYKLLPLQSVEAYILEHKHLPDVSSVAEVQQDGMDIAAIQAQLLKKIEELTLYVIEQNKRQEQQAAIIKTQGQLLKQLQTKLNALKVQSN